VGSPLALAFAVGLCTALATSAPHSVQPSGFGSFSPVDRVTLTGTYLALAGRIPQ
jgi:hypothetical protein